ncbi:DCC-interacting protein 13-beta isoform X5 [Zalophus californianus]|uniref:DCC-interacting protein 13-beta isoform X5 n=1 Tax=Zalophus californianus TaxID=9704 RepID=A0A6J2D7A6_ZALCA|nr:DCC-interacting protein 13-beta isoform X5 [Zalophus californianus]
MPAVDKLLLEEALQDSPQTRSLLSVFEEDAGTLTDYTNQLLQAMQRVYGAQNEMCLATQQLSKQLLAYEKQNFALGKGDEEVISTLHYFSKVVDELNVLHTELAKQLADTMVLPIIQFREKDLTEVSTLKDLFGLASNEHDLSMAKYSRLPKKKENEKVKTDVVKEVAATRRKQHLSSLQYYCALNALQYRKRVAMMEPMIGFAHGQINFFKKGAEMFSQNMNSFLSSVADMVQSIQVELEAEAEKMQVSQQELVSVDESVYTPDSDVAAPQINRNLIQKAGYLNLRRGIILQAESRKENEEWISAINNISRQIYLTDNPEAVAIKLNQTALQAVTPITSFGKKQESSCPRYYLVSPDRCHQKAKSSVPGVLMLCGGAPALGVREGAVEEKVRKWPQNLRNLELENDKIVPKAAARVPDADELIAPGTPIQFDIVLPATEFLDQNRGSRRINPFGETEDETFPEAEDSLLQQMFIVRFLGSMAVKTDNTTEVIYEAMRQVLAARAIHNIFRTTESHLLVTSQTLRLIDPQTQVTRANFELTSITQFAAHQENKRLVGFVVRTSESTGGEALSTYVFESNSEGEKICYAINLGKEIIEVQKDPEALAQLMLSIPLTNDGKYVLLNDQPDDNDGSPSENRGAESEA